MSRAHRSISVARCGCLLALALVLAPNAGCLMLARQAYHEVRGAAADLRPIRPVERPNLAPYGPIAFEPIATTLSEAMFPARLRAAYASSIEGARDELRPHYGGAGAPLRIESEMVYFQRRGLLGTGMLLTRIRVSSDAGQLADLLIVAETSSFREGGESDLTRVTYGALVRYLRGARGLPPEPPEEGELARAAPSAGA